MPAARTRSSPARKPPISVDDELQRAARACDRFLMGDGPRRAESLLATIPSDTEVDYYGVGGAVSALEREVARLLGTEAALFLPTGTMAQQAVLRVHAERRGCRTVAFHPKCHLDGWAEERGYQALHGLFGLPVGPSQLPLTTAELKAVRQPLAALLLELPQRSLGGTTPTWQELNAQVRWARQQGAAVHLDGARLWEVAPHYQQAHGRTMRDVVALFDSVYVSFYKGLAGLGGCCVGATKDVIDELAVWRTRHGGRAFMMWPYAASALTQLRTKLPRMPAYYRHARAIARSLAGLEGVEVLPDPPQSAMLHVRLSVSEALLRRRALAIARRERVWTGGRAFEVEGPNLLRLELQIGEGTLALSAAEIRHLFATLAGSESPS